MKNLKEIISASIKRKILFGYVLLIIIPLSLVAIFNYISSTRSVEEKTIKQLGVAGRVINGQFDQYFEDMDVISNDIAKNQDVQNRLREPYVEINQRGFLNLTEERLIENYLKGIYDRKPGISSIIIFGYNKMNCYYNPLLSWDNNYDSTKEPWFKKTVLADGKWVLSGRRLEMQLFTIGVKNRDEIVTFSRVVKDLDSYKPIGVIQINIELSYLSNMILAPVQEGSVTIVDENNSFIAGENQVKSGDNLDISTTSPMTGWKTIYHAPKKELIMEVKNIRNLIIIITIISTIFALLLANIISGSIARPVNILKHKMKSVGHGDFESFIDLHREDEIGELIEGFNYMVEKIKCLVAEIRNKEEQRLKTELIAQQARINPHFMYNTLNSFRWMAMMEGNNKMAKHITAFVYLLKFAAKNNKPLITIRDEICILEAYTDLMKMRYEKFKIAINAEENVLKLLTIPFLLQPIVENSIFHGIASIDREGLIEVVMVTEGDKVITRVKDNGAGMDEQVLKKLLLAEEDNHGSFNKIGIKNVYDRLKIQFSDQGDIKIKSTPGQGTEVEISWPAMMKGANLND